MPCITHPGSWQPIPSKDAWPECSSYSRMEKTTQATEAFSRPSKRRRRPEGRSTRSARRIRVFLKQTQITFCAFWRTEVGENVFFPGISEHSTSICLNYLR